MIFNLKDMEMIDDKNSYKILCEKNLICYFRGFLWSSGKEAGEESVKLLLKQYKKNKKIDFNELYGAYHIIFINKENNLVEFFSDNAGHCCFYYNKQKNLISDSFLEIIKVSEKVTPNYSAITEFIHFNCIYSEDTICKEISRTDAINFYMFQSRRLMSADKSLNIWESGKKYQELNDFISDTVYAAKNLKITDIITGGTDSRTVLAHLASL
ncbi:hypothetical protein, partial [Clostridium sp.]|uniref:hypothetical protein n=1 Tax=Clostridium sp. TaxID=1506 RepID=UPI002621FBA1